MKTLLFNRWRNGIEPIDVRIYARKELLRNGVDELTVKIIVDDLYDNIKENCIKLLKGTSILNNDVDKTIALKRVRRDMINTLGMCYFNYHMISKHSYDRTMQFIDYIVDEQKKKFDFNQKIWDLW